MALLNKQQTEHIRIDLFKNGVTLPELEAELLDYLCSAVEQELEHQPDFELAYQNVLQTLKPNELKMTQEKTQDLLDNKVSFLQKVVYSTLFVLLVSIFGYMIALPWAGGMISVSLISLIGIYVYSNIRWYFRTDGKSRMQKGYTVGAAFIVFLFIISVVFKLYHWPGAGILMVSSLGILIFLPILMSLRFFLKGTASSSHIIMEVIEKNQKKAEFVLLSIFLLGFGARLLMIDFLGNMFIIASLFCFAFLFITYTWPVFASPIPNRFRLLLLITSTMAYGVAIVTGLFKIMNWPFPFIDFSMNLPYILLSLMACTWYGFKIYQKKSSLNIILFFLSLILLVYSWLLLGRISPFPELQQWIYNVPVLILFLTILFFYYKHLLFRVAATCLLGYYLLAFPYAQMPNKSIVTTIYGNDNKFLDLYERSYQNPQNEEYLKQLLEYNYNKTISQK